MTGVRLERGNAGSAIAAEGDQVPVLENRLLVESLQVLAGTLGADRYLASDALGHLVVRPPALLDGPVIVPDPSAEVTPHCPDLPGVTHDASTVGERRRPE